MPEGDFSEFKERILAELKRLNDVCDLQQQQIVNNRLELARLEQLKKWIFAAVGAGITATFGFIFQIVHDFITSIKSSG